VEPETILTSEFDVVGIVTTAIWGGGAGGAALVESEVWVKVRRSRQTQTVAVLKTRQRFFVNLDQPRESRFPFFCAFSRLVCTYLLRKPEQSLLPS
jgi:hypothetical protein